MAAPSPNWRRARSARSGSSPPWLMATSARRKRSPVSDVAKPASAHWDFGRLSLSRQGAFWALVVLLVFNIAFTPHFASWQTLNVNLTQVATIVIVGVGM